VNLQLSSFFRAHGQFLALVAFLYSFFVLIARIPYDFQDQLNFLTTAIIFSTRSISFSMHATAATLLTVIALAGCTMAAPMPRDIFAREIQALAAREPLFCGILPSGIRINCSGAVHHVRDHSSESGAFSISQILKQFLPAIDKREAEILARALEEESGAFSLSGFLQQLFPNIHRRDAVVLARALEEESGAFSISSILKSFLPAIDKREIDYFVARAVTDAESGAFSLSGLFKSFFPAIDRRSLYELD